MNKKFQERIDLCNQMIDTYCTYGRTQSGRKFVWYPKKWQDPMLLQMMMDRLKTLKRRKNV